MNNKDNGMRAYAMAASAATSAGVTVGGLTLCAIFAKNAILNGDTKAAGLSLAGAAFAAGAALSTYRQCKSLYRLSKGETTPEKQETKQAPNQPDPPQEP